MRNGIAYATSLLLVGATLAGCLAGPDAGEDIGTLEMGSATIAPGNKAGLPLILEGTDWDANTTALRVVEDGGLDVSLPERATMGDDGALIAWVSIAAAGDAPGGVHPVVVALETDDGGVASARFTVRVAAPDPPLEAGQTVTLNLTLRTEDGRIVSTNDPDTLRSALPFAPGADPPPEDPQPFPLQLAPNPQLPAGLLDALLASGVGQRVQAEAPEAFGPRALERDEPRTETVPREASEQRQYPLQRAMAEEQGLIPPGAQAGDPVDVPAGDLPYVIESINETLVVIVLDVEEGETHTLHEAWPGASEVVEETDELVVFRTTPPVEPGEPFTWRPEWPDATAVTTMDDESIELLHSPPEGLRYTATTQQGERTNATVERVGQESITVSEENTHPLAGQTLYFELVIVDVQDGPAAPAGAPGAPPS